MDFPRSIISDQYDVLKRRANYRIAQSFDVFDAFQPDHQNLTCQIFKVLQRLH